MTACCKVWAGLPRHPISISIHGAIETSSLSRARTLAKRTRSDHKYLDAGKNLCELDVDSTSTVSL